MPYLNTKNRSDIKGSIRVKVDLTDKLLQVYDETTNYSSFNIEYIIGCSVLISKTENPNLIVNISYFDKNRILSFIKLHLFNSELKKNEYGGVVLTEWIKECLKKDKSFSEFMIVDNDRSKKNQIEIE